MAPDKGVGLTGALGAEANAKYARGLARALLGAMIFALPMLMTMEMWELGTKMGPLRLTTLLLATVPMLVTLSFYAGFEATFSLLDNVLDAFAALAVSGAACLIVMALFGVIGPGMPAGEITGKLAVLSSAGGIGALLADKQFSGDRADEDDRREAGRSETQDYAGRLFMMGVGAIFLALNVAPTDEIEVIAAQIHPWQAALLACASLGALHAILTIGDPECGPLLGLRHVSRSMAGYGLSLSLCGFILWCFGRLDGLALAEAGEQIVVLAFPASLGAGAARLILGKGEGEHG